MVMVTGGTPQGDCLEEGTIAVFRTGIEVQH